MRGRAAEPAREVAGAVERDLARSARRIPGAPATGRWSRARTGPPAARRDSATASSTKIPAARRRGRRLADDGPEAADAATVVVDGRRGGARARPTRRHSVDGGPGLLGDDPAHVPVGTPRKPDPEPVVAVAICASAEDREDGAHAGQRAPRADRLDAVGVHVRARAGDVVTEQHRRALGCGDTAGTAAGAGAATPHADRDAPLLLPPRPLGRAERSRSGDGSVAHPVNCDGPRRGLQDRGGARAVAQLQRLGPGGVLERDAAR